MKKNKKSNDLNLPENKGDHKDRDKLNGYPEYPAREDIYQQYQEEKNIDPEDITMKKAFSESDEVKFMNELDYTNDETGSDLDIPGLEMNNILDKMALEDEENDYYSLGGDDHNDLEEDQGE